MALQRDDARQVPAEGGAVDNRNWGFRGFEELRVGGGSGFIVTKNVLPDTIVAGGPERIVEKIETR